MIQHRPVSELGWTHTPVLEAHHHFCFAGYQDANFLNWGRLRVLNHNLLAANKEPSSSFHSATEVLFIVREGAIFLEKDDGKSVAVGPNEIASIATGLGTEFAVRSAAGQQAQYTVLWLTAPEADYRPKYRGIVGDLSNSDWIAADGFDGSHNLRWDIPVSVRLLRLGAGPWSISLSGSKSYITVLDGSISVGGRTVGKYGAMLMEDESAMTGISRGDSLILVFDDFGTDDLTSA